MNKAMSNAAMEYDPILEAQFDPNDPGFLTDPHSTYNYLREHSPVYFHEKLHGWMITRYEDAAPLLKDPRLSHNFSAWEYSPPKKKPEEMSEFEMLMSSATFQLGREDHTRIRKLVLPAFSPRVMDAMKVTLRRVINELFDELGEPESFNFVAEIGNVVPIQSISSLVGVPKEGEHIFTMLNDAIMKGISPVYTPEERAEAVKDVPEGLAMLRTLIDERRKNPIENDFITALITAEEDDERLSTWEMLALIGILIAAGSGTATVLLNRLVWCLHKAPQQRKLLESQPELIQNALTEVIRYDFFYSTGQQRYALEDFEFKGHLIKKGQMVLLPLGSMHRDPDYFENPDEFDIERSQKHNCVFGLGPHYCMGATVARAQGEVAYQILLERFPNYEVIGEIQQDLSLGGEISELWVKTNINNSK